MTKAVTATDQKGMCKILMRNTSLNVAGLPHEEVTAHFAKRREAAEKTLAGSGREG
jgi:hypothetical protein